MEIEDKHFQKKRIIHHFFGNDVYKLHKIGRDYIVTHLEKKDTIYFSCIGDVNRFFNEELERIRENNKNKYWKGEKAK